MCLLFFNVNDDCKSDDFRLILVNNRDEFWQRPAKSAHFWTARDRSCISGLDQEPGREGGSWFGATNHGRIACLVNISAQQDSTKRGRGFLVTDFLTKDDTIESYAKEISSQKNDYNGFILTLIELRKTGTKVVRVTNDKLADEAAFQSQPCIDDIYSVGNSPLNFPWRKVSEGQDRFGNIVKAHRTVSRRDQLKEQLFQLMGDRTRYWPDPQLEKQGQECGWQQESMETKSAVFVWDPTRQYGTRTTTVLLIDGKGNCDYTEKTLQTPVDVNSPRWSSVDYSYKLQPLNSVL